MRRPPHSNCDHRAISSLPESFTRLNPGFLAEDIPIIEPG